MFISSIIRVYITKKIRKRPSKNMSRWEKQNLEGRNWADSSNILYFPNAHPFILIILLNFYILFIFHHQFIVIIITSYEQQHQNVSVSEIRFFLKFNTFMMHRMIFIFHYYYHDLKQSFCSWLKFYISIRRSMVSLPKLTKEGYRILTYRLQIYNISHITFANAVKVSKYAKTIRN